MTEDQYESFAKYMEETYPLIFSEQYGGFAVGPGWWPIIKSLCRQIQHHIDWKSKQGNPIPQVTVLQIKEKFGGLRFYYNGGDDVIDGMVRMAESWAGHHCEECGVPGEMRHGGWIRTLCDKHEEERQEKYAKRNGLEL